jgi:hypothetical protein
MNPAASIFHRPALPIYVTFNDTVSGLGYMAWKTFLLCSRFLSHNRGSFRYGLCTRDVNDTVLQEHFL